MNGKKGIGDLTAACHDDRRQPCEEKSREEQTERATDTSTTMEASSGPLRVRSPATCAGALRLVMVMRGLMVEGGVNTVI